MKKVLSILICAVVLCGTAVVYPDTAVPMAMVSQAATDYDWSGYLKKDSDWFASDEAITLANEIVQYQLSDGGWRKAMDDTAQTGSWGKSTVDNDATTSQIRILARVYQQTGNQTYLDSCLKGIDLLLNGQYDNGGWPQVFDDAGTYHAHITFNDGAMVRILYIMQEVAQKSGDFPFIDDARAQKAATAVDKGVRCILDVQIEQNGVKTAWCQQHDEFTLEPAAARAYELPSISASESVGVVNFLKTVAEGNNEIIRAINAAITWMDNVKIMGIRVEDTGDDRVVVEDASAGPIWARFYNLETNQPMFVDRDGSIHDTMAELSQERRTGYSWYGSWPQSLVEGGLMEEVEEQPYIYTGQKIATLQVYDNANALNWSIQQNLQVGSFVFGDRDVTYTAVPNALLGAEYVRPACDSKTYTGDLGNLVAATDLVVSVALDTRLNPVPAWLSEQGFAVTDMTLTSSNDVTFQVYQRTLSAGESVTLGSNTTGTSVVNYVAMVSEPYVETTTTTTTTTTETTTTTTTETTTTSTWITPTLMGDVDCNGIVNVADAVLLARYVAEDSNVSVTDQGLIHAEMNGVSGLSAADTAALIQHIAGAES